jgi:hypothetical protein
VQEDEEEVVDPNEDKEESIAVVQVVVVVVDDDEVVKVAARDGIICSFSKVLCVKKKRKIERNGRGEERPISLPDERYCASSF